MRSTYSRTSSALLLALFARSASAQAVIDAIAAPGDAFLLGTALAPCGDLDGDGIADFASGAMAGDSMVLAYSGATLAPLWEAALPAALGIATALAAAGDVNGDGRGDLVAGFGAANRVSVLSGGDGAVLRTFAVPPDSPGFGAAVAGGGDVDGDGIADQVVGAPGATNPAAQSGAVHVYSGATGSLIESFAGSGVQRLGSAVALFDADGDGRADIAAAAPGASELRVYSGAGGGLVYAAAVPGLGTAAAALAPIDDLDGDFRRDLLVGAQYTGSGKALALSGASGATLLAIPAPIAGEAFGGAVAAAGDLDGDGTADLLVGAPAAYVGGKLLGRAYAFSGASGAAIWSFSDIASPGVGRGFAALPDLDHDGKPETAIAATAAAGLQPLSFGEILVVSTVDCGSALPFGSACGGPFGAVSLALSGCARSGAPVSLIANTNFGSGSHAFFFFGLSQGSTPLPGGCALGISPLLPAIAVVPIQNGPGEASLSAVVPALAAPATLYAQAVARNKLDHTLTVSNGLAITFLP